MRILLSVIVGLFAGLFAVMFIGLLVLAARFGGLVNKRTGKR
jgi:hypothetical protein